MALRQTTESRDQSTPFVPSGDYVDLGSYEDFVFMHEVKSSVGFDVTLRTSSIPTILGMELAEGLRGRELYISLDLAYLSSTDRIYLAKSVVRIDDIEVNKESKRGNQIGRSYRTSFSLKDRLTATLGDSRSAKFYATPPIRADISAMASHRVENKQMPLKSVREVMATQFAKVVEDLVLQEFSQIYYIGPLREWPRRIYISTGETPREVGSTGELGPEVWWSASEIRGLGLEGRLAEWCSRMGLAFDIGLSTIQGGLFQVIIDDAYSKVPVNLPDVGFGTSQILPILIQGLIAPPGATLLLEQPEIHLHPKVQADLADFLIEVSQRGVGVIVETHSEHLITRLQRRIAEESLEKEELAIYYVTPSSEGSTLARVEVDSYGQISSAPSGFFEEGYEETFALMRAVGERKANNGQPTVVE